MKHKLADMKTKIFDWFIITRIRILNFIKEHKYLSIGIGTFVVSCIAILIVFASNNYDGRIASKVTVFQKGVETTEEITEIDSFSTVVYDLTYILSLMEEEMPEQGLIRDSVVIEATFNKLDKNGNIVDEDIDVSWKTFSDEFTNYELSQDKKTLYLSLYNVEVAKELKQQLYLNVNNVMGDASSATPEIKVDIRIKESTSAYSQTVSKNISVNNNKIIDSLDYKVVGGKAYKSTEYKDGRLAPFGIVVGIEKENLTSLQGVYFEPSATLKLLATQDLDTQLLLSDSYGIYNSDINYISGIPTNIYDSGKISSLSQIGAKSSDVNKFVTTPEISLHGEKTINLKIGENYIEYGIKNDKEVLCINQNDKCTRSISIVNEDKNLTEVSYIDTSKESNYVISYFYKENESASVTLTRNVKVSGEKEKKEVITNTVDDETGETTEVKTIYTLLGNETVLLPTGSIYNIEGILKDGSSSGIVSSYTIYNDEDEIIKNDDNTPITKLSDKGTFKIIYELFEEDGQTPLKDSQGENITLTRIIKIEDFSLIHASNLTTNELYYSLQDNFDYPSVEIDGETKKCTPENNCSVTYYSDQNYTIPAVVDNSKPSIYFAKYTLTDKNNFVLTSTNKIIFQAIYELKIENIKSNGELNLFGNDFIALGAYYVNVKSPRTEEQKGNIEVKLTVGEEFATVINEFYSEGTKTANLSFYSDETGSLQELTEENKNNYLAYGEEVILSSKFNYYEDGDDEISTLSNTINLDSTFKMINYSFDDTDLDYYLLINGKRVVAIENNKLKYLSGYDKDNNPEYAYIKELSDFNISFNNDESGNIKSVLYTAKNVVPNTKIELRLRLTVAPENHGENVGATSTFNYVQNNGQINKNINANTNINITAFKARNKLLVNNNEYDLIVNGASDADQILSWSLYPTINMPAEEINTNSVGFDTIKNIDIIVTLPKGINYIYNELYDIPKISKQSDGTTKLTYNLNNKKINEWIDPILFETDFDVDIPSGSNLKVTAVISATSTTGVTDTSLELLRTASRTITYQNNEEIATTMHSEYKSISKNTPFTIETKIYNNSGNNYNNLELITILPELDSTDKNNFDGSYVIDKNSIPSGAFCTNELVTKENVLSSEVVWDECEFDEDVEYGEITAIKIPIEVFDRNTRFVNSSITIKPEGNKAGNTYTLKSYLTLKEQNKVIEVPSITIDIISKMITGLVFEDFDSNGLFDSTEKNVEGVTMHLYDSSDDSLVQTTTTNEKGIYSFGDLKEGTYYIVAEYNSVKYGLSPRRDDINDKSKKTSFDAFSIDSYGSLTLSEEDFEYDEEDDYYDADGDDEFIEDEEDDEFFEDEDEEELEKPRIIVKTIEDIEVNKNTKLINNINLGLALKKEYAVKLRKYVTKSVVTNNIGVSTVKDYGNVSLAKLDVKDINKLNIKVVYTIELENIGYYPGFIYSVKDYIPDGMRFNPNYEENKGWIENEDGYLENNTLSEELIYEGDKKYLTVAFDIVRKEAGSFINYAVIEDDDLQILTVANLQGESGDIYE